MVLSGEGRAFSAGLDFKSFLGEGGGGLLGREEGSPANRAQRAAFVWQEVPVLVIAAVHGVAFGGGLQIALGADIRYATPDAQPSIMEIKWGIVPDMSGTQTLRCTGSASTSPRSSRSRGASFPGTEAERLGLVTRVVDSPREAALEAARDIAARSPDAIRATKALLNASRLSSDFRGARARREVPARSARECEPDRSGHGQHGEEDARVPGPLDPHPGAASALRVPARRGRRAITSA